MYWAKALRNRMILLTLLSLCLWLLAACGGGSTATSNTLSSSLATATLTPQGRTGDATVTPAHNNPNVIECLYDVQESPCAQIGIAKQRNAVGQFGSDISTGQFNAAYAATSASYRSSHTLDQMKAEINRRFTANSSDLSEVDPSDIIDNVTFWDGQQRWTIRLKTTTGLTIPLDVDYTDGSITKIYADTQDKVYL